MNDHKTLADRLLAFEGSDALGNGDFSLLREAAAALTSPQADKARGEECPECGGSGDAPSPLDAPGCVTACPSCAILGSEPEKWLVGDEVFDSEAEAIEAIRQWGPSGSIAIPLYTTPQPQPSGGGLPGFVRESLAALPPDDFRNDNFHLVACIEALLSLDKAGALVPRGVGGHARRLLASAAHRLATITTPQAQGERDGWLPIESAPKSVADGRHVEGIYLLGFVPDADMSGPEAMLEVIWWEPLLQNAAGGRGKWCSTRHGEDAKPTHWRPLPAPPAIAVQQPKGAGQ